MSKRKNETDAEFIVGCQVLRANTPPGVTRSVSEIAYMAGCSEWKIQEIIRTAVKKLKVRGQGRIGTEIREIISSMQIDTTQTAIRKPCYGSHDENDYLGSHAEEGSDE